MLQVPDEIGERFEAAMQSVPVTEHLRPHFRRWLRFYLDFCAKYGFDSNIGSSFRKFNAKLRDKGQDEWRRRQAHEAVVLYIHEVVGNNTELSLQHDKEGKRETTPVRSGASAAIDALADTVQGEFGYQASCSSSSIPEERSEAGDLRIPANSQQIPTEGSLSHQLTDASKPASDDQSTPSTSQDHNRRVAAPHDENTVTATGVSWVWVYDKLEASIKVRHYSPKTLQSYRSWIRKFQSFTKSKTPTVVSMDDVKNFLTFLAVKKKVAASSQNQAFNALLFLFRHVFEKEFGQVEGVVRAKKRPYIPVVLSRQDGHSAPRRHAFAEFFAQPIRPWGAA